MSDTTQFKIQKTREPNITSSGGRVRLKRSVRYVPEKILTNHDLEKNGRDERLNGFVRGTGHRNNAASRRATNTRRTSPPKAAEKIAPRARANISAQNKLI